MCMGGMNHPQKIIEGISDAVQHLPHRGDLLSFVHRIKTCKQIIYPRGSCFKFFILELHMYNTYIVHIYVCIYKYAGEKNTFNPLAIVS